MKTEYELKRGDVIRNKSTGINCIFYSYYRPADSHDTIYALMQEFETPQIVSIDFYEPTGENIDIFEKLSQGEPSDEKNENGTKINETDARFILEQ